MRPTLATFDATYGVFTNSIIYCYFALQAIVFSNGNDLLGCELGRCAPLAAIACAMFYSVRLISSSSVPAKIADSVVLRVSVVMAAFMLVWRRANESEKDKSVYLHHFALISPPEKDAESPVLRAHRGFFGFPGPHIPHVANIRDFVKPLKSGDRTPIFHKIPDSVLLRYGIVPVKGME